MCVHACAHVYQHIRICMNSPSMNKPMLYPRLSSVTSPQQPSSPSWSTSTQTTPPSRRRTPTGYWPWPTATASPDCWPCASSTCPSRSRGLWRGIYGMLRWTSSVSGSGGRRGRGQQVGVEAEGKSGGVKMDLWCISILCMFC